jgi:hypothetical protein
MVGWRITTMLSGPALVILAVINVFAGVSPGSILSALVVVPWGLLMTRYSLRSKIVLTSEELVITNTIKTYQIPLASVVTGACSNSGIMFKLQNGTIVRSTVAQGKGLALQLLKKEVFGDRIVKTVLQAAEEARVGAS